jgi:large subunit ribosomal protein L13e
VQAKKLEACAEKVEVQKNSDPANAEARKEPSEMHHVKPEISKKEGKKRSGRGFSIEELEKAGLTSADARRLEIPMDKRRTTVHDWNIEVIKAYVEKVKAQDKPKKKRHPKKKAKK